MIVGTVGDVAGRYGQDAAWVWEAITCGWVVRNPDGADVVLVADPAKRIREAQWQIEEVPAN